jgi:hypothetical protein
MSVPITVTPAEFELMKFAMGRGYYPQGDASTYARLRHVVHGAATEEDGRRALVQHYEVFRPVAVRVQRDLATERIQRRRGYHPGD